MWGTTYNHNSWPTAKQHEIRTQTSRQIFRFPNENSMTENWLWCFFVLNSRKMAETVFPFPNENSMMEKWLPSRPNMVLKCLSNGEALTVIDGGKLVVLIISKYYRYNPIISRNFSGIARHIPQLSTHYYTVPHTKNTNHIFLFFVSLIYWNKPYIYI